MGTAAAINFEDLFDFSPGHDSMKRIALVNAELVVYGSQFKNCDNRNEFSYKL